MNAIVEPSLPRLVSSVSLLAALLMSTASPAAEPCGLCDRQIVTNSILASCFLEAFPALQGKAGGAVIVDLSTCEQERGIVDALRMPGADELEPDVQFILTPEQLSCLKAQLERPDLVLDPTATISLESCP